MILSASRRTDLPRYHLEWFLNRLAEGYASVSNPFRPSQVRHVPLSPDAVDGIVFWSKYPAAMLLYLETLSNYPYYIQFTITPYDTKIEPGIPDKDGLVIPCFQQFAEQIGPARVIWRYDPILINEYWTTKRHTETFSRIAHKLCGYTEQCIISFLDSYRHIASTIRRLGIREPDETEKRDLVRALADIAREHKIQLSACAEPIDFTTEGVSPARCIDAALLTRIAGRSIVVKRDSNQRPACGCSQSMDLGTYQTCPAGCVYCYARKGQTL